MSRTVVRRGPGGWSFSDLNPLRIVYRNPAPSAVGAVISAQSLASAGTVAQMVVQETVKVGGLTAGVVTTLQLCVDLTYYLNGSIGAGDVGRRLVRNVTVNGSAVLGGVGGSAVGGTIGTAIFPGTGTVVGSVIGGVLGGIGMGKVMNDKFEQWWGVREFHIEDPNALLREALDLFGYQESDFERMEVINMDSVTKKYRQLAKEKHPDRRGGSDVEFKQLVTYYTVLLSKIEERDRKMGNQAGVRSSFAIEDEMSVWSRERDALNQNVGRLQSRVQHLEQENAGVNAENSDLRRKLALIESGGFTDIPL